jgi:S-adenosylmethionine hydrolase
MVMSSELDKKCAEKYSRDARDVFARVSAELKIDLTEEYLDKKSEELKSFYIERCRVLRSEPGKN